MVYNNYIYLNQFLKKRQQHYNEKIQPFIPIINFRNQHFCPKKHRPKSHRTPFQNDFGRKSRTTRPIQRLRIRHRTTKLQLQKSIGRNKKRKSRLDAERNWRRRNQSFPKISLRISTQNPIDIRTRCDSRFQNNFSN